MATNKIVGITIDIEGKNSGLTKSLQEVNKDLNKTQAALKDVNKALELDPTNVDLLAQKEELLNKQVDETNDKLKILRTVAEDAAKGLEEGTVSREAYASLAAEIVKTEASLSTLSGSAEDNADAFGDVESGADAAADEIEEVNKASDETGSGLKALEGVAAATGAAMAAAFTAAVTAAKEAAGALVDATVSAGDYVDQIHTLEMQTGISAERLQEMNYVTGLIDVSVETMTGAMTKLEKSMNSANETDAKYYETLAALDEQLNAGKITQEEYNESVQEALEKSTTAYDKLGVSVLDSSGNLRDNEEVFWEVIEALGNIENETERDLLAMELMGKSAKDLNPLILAGADAFNELAQEAHDVGYVMDDETLNAYQQFDDQMERLDKGAEAAKNALGMILLPSLNNLASSGTGMLNKFTTAVQQSDGSISAIGDVIAEILPEVVSEMNKDAEEITSLISSVVMTITQILIDNLPLLLDSTLQIITTLTDGLLSPDNLAKILDAAVNILLSITSYLVENLPLILDAAVQIILAVVQGLTSAIPQLIPAVIDAVLTIVDTLLAGDQLAMILNAGLQLIIALAGALVDALPQIIDRLPEIIEGIVSFLTGDALPDLIQAGIDLITAIVSDMPTIIGAVLEALGQLIVDMVDYITGGGAEDLMTGFFEAFWNIIDAASDWGADIIDALISGITSAASDLWDELTDIADGIKDFLGFSVPEKGPLHEWAYNNPGADMVDLFAEGIDDQLPELQQSIDLMTGTISGASSIDYTGQLTGINNNLATIAGADNQIIVPVYIGQEHLETIIARANANISFMSGGR